MSAIIPTKRNEKFKNEVRDSIRAACTQSVHTGRRLAAVAIKQYIAKGHSADEIEAYVDRLLADAINMEKAAKLELFGEDLSEAAE